MRGYMRISPDLEGKNHKKFIWQDGARPASHPHALSSSSPDPPRPAFLLLLITKCAAFLFQQLVKLSRSTADPLYMQLCRLKQL